MSLLSETNALKKAIREVAKEVVREETRDCLRAKKAVVIAAPLGNSCTVRFVGEDTSSGGITIPYSTEVSGAEVGDSVWVLIPYGSLRNAIAWKMGDFVPKTQ